ncbi:M48 family metalloprotease [uncultured Microscilla sp.]|uniref:M48 family metalloprotease n=1 Tax=uncultured Microscilla sp. TaxID=432653 RepID=UPI002611B6A4|nr:M48 family metalloprotease [uncultured Microscilla sp.]
MNSKLATYLVAFLLILGLSDCTMKGQAYKPNVTRDVRIGKQVRNEVVAKMRILDRTQYAQAYQHLDKMANTILQSKEIRFRSEFEWKLYIVHDDNTINAFVTPGGYIFVYTGLIRYLETEDQLAGVLGHEIAHAERRHSIKNLNKRIGTTIALTILLGNGSTANLANTLLGLTFSRSAEREADNYSVMYLADTHYQCNALSEFFDRMAKEGGNKKAAWLSTHPASEDRVVNINKKAQKINCQTVGNRKSLAQIKNSLPPR